MLKVVNYLAPVKHRIGLDGLGNGLILHSAVRLGSVGSGTAVRRSLSLDHEHLEDLVELAQVVRINVLPYLVGKGNVGTLR